MKLEESIYEAKNNADILQNHINHFAKKEPFLAGNFGKNNQFENDLFIYESKGPKDIIKDLVEIEGEFKGFSQDKILLITNNDTDMICMLNKEPVYSKSIKENKVIYKENIYMIAIKAKEYPIYIPVVVLRSNEKDIFNNINNMYGKILAIKDFYALDKAKRSFILEQVKANKHQKQIVDNAITFKNKHEQMLRYALTKECYPIETQSAIETMFNDTNASKHKVEQRLDYIFKINPTSTNESIISSKEFITTLDKYLYKMNTTKKLVKDIFISRQYAKSKGCKLLFVGPPGVGKTSLMQAISKAANLPYECIPLNGLSTPFELEGLDPGYDSSDAGVITKAFASKRTTNMIINFDEFDKMNRHSKEGDPMNVFLRLFLGNHYDKFLQCTIKTDNTIFIATANSTDDIPEVILNRFDSIIYFENYSDEDKIEISKQYIIPKLINDYNLKSLNIKFEDKAIKHIITNYCQDEGARDLKHNLKNIIINVIASSIYDITVDCSYVDKVLNLIVTETPALVFNRNKECYSKPLQDEIKKCILVSKKDNSSYSDHYKKDKTIEKLDYLLACRKEKYTFIDEFNPNNIKDILHKNIFGMDKVINEMINFYYIEYLNGIRLNSNLALIGTYGVGKSSVIKYLAKAMNYKYTKISLNGINDVKELKGSPLSYAGSSPGRIMKAIKDAGTTRLIIQLDELDKLKKEYAGIILELLDHEFNDSFINVPIDLSQVIFIATLNDWNNIPLVIKDRFIPLYIEGYSRDDKLKILSNYIIPEIENSYCIKINMNNELQKYLLKEYCVSIGIRDVKKAMQRICSSKLVKINNAKIKEIDISQEDIDQYLDKKINNENFLNYAIPGVSKALAVSGNTGSCFPIETVLLEGNGKVEITGLPKDSAIESVKIALTNVKKLYPKLLLNKDIHVHFGQGAIVKDGPSAGVALFMSILSATINKPLMNNKPNDIGYTGEISLTGGVFPVGGLTSKIQAAIDSGCTKVFIPQENYNLLDKNKLNKYECSIIPVSHLSQIINEIYPELKLGVCMLNI